MTQALSGLSPCSRLNIKKAEIKAGGKVWNAKTDWLNHPTMINGFIPLSREEAGQCCAEKC
jgi:hypothetical protein